MTSPEGGSSSRKRPLLGGAEKSGSPSKKGKNGGSVNGMRSPMAGPAVAAVSAPAASASDVGASPVGTALLDLHRLLHALEDRGPTSSASDNIARLAQAEMLWRRVAPWLNERDPSQAAKIEERMRAADKLVPAEMRPAAAAAASAGSNDLVQRIFFDSSKAEESKGSQSKRKSTRKSEAGAAVASSSSGRGESRGGARTPSVSKVPSAPPPTPLQDLQEEQRDQMESAIRQMAATLKTQTQSIHSQLQSQTQELGELEDVAEDNVAQVTQVAGDVKDQVKRNWSRAFGRWGMLIMIVAAFLFCLITIKMVPKRVVVPPSAPEATDEFCRVLPDGKRECLAPSAYAEKTDLEPGLADTEAESDGGATAISEEEEDAKEPQEECVLDMNGECVADVKESDEVNNEADAVAPEDVVGVPMYKGTPFAKTDLRRAAASGENELLSGYLGVMPDWVDSADTNGWTALHMAARAGQGEAIRILLDAGADRYLETDSGKIAVEIVEEEYGEDHPAVETLAEYEEEEYDDEEDDENYDEEEGDWDSDDEEEEGEYDYDDEDEELEGDELEEEEGEGAREEGGDPGYTLDDLHDAAGSGDAEQVRSILEYNPELVNVADENRWTPIHVAASRGHVECVEALLEYGADTDAVNNFDETALDTAVNELGEDHPIAKVLRGGDE